MNKTLVIGTGGQFVHPRLRPKTRELRHRYTVKNARIRTANRSTGRKIINEKSSNIIGKSANELNIPISRLTGEDTSRTDLDVINPSMHIAETDCNCKHDDKLKQVVPSPTKN